MGVNLSIKNVPEAWVERLRKQAVAHHRSLQGELMNILEQTLQSPQMTLEQLWTRARASGLRSPSESAHMIREDRDTDHGRGR